ncbi:transposase [Paraburkholderia sp.]|uniref:transposase n=1 Tax=Paraburkholderia sp. TaxID=1926495 RepID=UPI003D6DD088
MSPHRDVTDEEWQRVAPLIPELEPRRDMRGRPLANTRAVLNGVLWVIYSSATWSSMPRRYPPYQTCHRRFKLWLQSGALQRVLEALFGVASHTLLHTVVARTRRRTVRQGARSERPAGAGVARGMPALSLPVPAVVSASSPVTLPGTSVFPAM